VVKTTTYINGPNKAYLVSDLERTVRKENSMGTDVIEGTLRMIRTTPVSAPLIKFGSWFGIFGIAGLNTIYVHCW
jgi:hypothetical protein